MPCRLARIERDRLAPPPHRRDKLVPAYGPITTTNGFIRVDRVSGGEISAQNKEEQLHRAEENDSRHLGHALRGERDAPAEGKEKEGQRAGYEKISDEESLRRWPEVFVRGGASS